VLDALNCLAVFAIARVMCPRSYVPALLAAILCALCPYTIYYTRAILKESVATSLLTWTMLFAMLAIRDGGRVWGALAGAGFGLVALCTPQFLPFAPLLAGVIVIAHRRAARVAVRVAAVLVLAWASVIAPWTLRNYVVFGRFIPVSTGDLGYRLFLGTFESNTNWTGWNEFPDEIFATESDKQEVLAARDRFLEEVTSGSVRVTESDRFFRQLALERFRADPLGSLVLGLRRLPRLWFQFYIPMYRHRNAARYLPHHGAGSQSNFFGSSRERSDVADFR
jgi:4-amino-4-deoxy-L-arabinose transferase-like glycosyltransferase